MWYPCYLLKEKQLLVFLESWNFMLERLLATYNNINMFAVRDVDAMTNR